MRADVAEAPFEEIDAELHVIGLAEGEKLPDRFAGAPGASDVRTAFRKLTLLRPGAPERLLVAGLGDATKLDSERLRVVAALAVKRAGELEARRLAWLLPAQELIAGDRVAAALVEGSILAAYRFDRFREPDDDDPPPPALEALTLGLPGAGSGSLAGAVHAARVAAEAQNRARDLQNLPANVATPSFLADRARELAAAHSSLSAEILGREEIAERGLGGLVAVSQGTEQEPRLITLRYAGGGAGGTLGLVGKAVTFDSGGISIKPSAGMQEMKMDMSGGAAVLEAVGAIAELGLSLELVAVVPATENLPSGSAVKPGDIIRQLGGKTVEVNNTDAEGRLILADALTWCVREMGAERIVDLATLTGAVLIALGSTYAAEIANDDAWAEVVREAAERSGEIIWRLPLHPEYKELTKGTVADLTNAASKRKAGTIYAGSFLEEFVDDTPWVHLDIAGTSWDTGREYWGSGPTGFGVRLLVELARDLASA